MFFRNGVKTVKKSLRTAVLYQNIYETLFKVNITLIIKNSHYLIFTRMVVS